MLAVLIGLFFSISLSGHIEAGCSVKNGIFFFLRSEWVVGGGVMYLNRDPP